jgi:tetratricopeptide (TPR) repeat protein
MKKTTFLICSILCLLACTIYLQTLSFEYTLDDGLVTDKISGAINDLQSLKELYTWRYNNIDYRPITFLSFGIENWIVGILTPKISHCINMVLFIAILLSLFLLFKTIIPPPQQHVGIWAGMLLFACHPLCVEVVASVKSRDGLLSMLFTTLSLTILLSKWKREHLLKIFLGIVLLVIASLAKLDAMGALLFIPSYLIIENGIKKEALQKVLKVFSILFFCFIVNSLLIKHFAEPINLESELGFVSITENSIVDRFTFFNRIGFLVQTNLIYLGKIFFPLNLRYYYGFSFYDLKNIGHLSTLIILAVHLMVFYFFYRQFQRQKVWIILALGYFSFLAFALNFVEPVAGVVADRYVFMALPWICILFCSVVYEGFKHFKVGVFFTPTFLLILGALILLSYQRTSVWKNNLTLIEHDAPYLTNSYEGMRIASYVYKSESDSSRTSQEQKQFLLKALECAKNANKIYPHNIYMHSFEGSYHFALEDYKAAIASFKNALQIDSTHKEANTILGDTYYKMGDLENALKYYTIAFSKDSNDFVLVNNIGTVLYEKNDKVESLNFSLRLIEKDSTNAAAWENLGYYYLVEQDTNTAKEYFKQALKMGLPIHMLPIPLN